MIARSHSSSPLLLRLLSGRGVRGTVLDPRQIRFGDYVVNLTEPLAPRMPNGIECAIVARTGETAMIGGGKIVVGAVEIDPGPGWNPAPPNSPLKSWPPGPEPEPGGLAAIGARTAHAGDDLMAGYVAGLVLLHGRRDRAARIAERVAAGADAFGATIIRHAARGEVPEPVHVLVATGNPHPLLEFGHGSGHSWLRGMISAGLLLEEWPAARVKSQVESYG